MQFRLVQQSVITNMLYLDNYESSKDKNLTKAELDDLVHHNPTNKHIFKNNITTTYAYKLQGCFRSDDL